MDKALGRMLLQFAENPQSLGYNTEDLKGQSPGTLLWGCKQTNKRQKMAHTHVEVPTEYTYPLLKRGALVSFFSVL